MARWKIISEAKVDKGICYEIEVDGETIKILITHYSMFRIEQRWQIKLEDVIETLLFPEEVVKGHRDRFIAHKVFGEHVFRAVYEYEEGTSVLITIYFPYAGRYFEGGGNFEDKIFR